MIFSQDNPIKLYLVDDHKILRESLKFLLEAEGDFQVIGCSDDGLNLEKSLAENVPDVILLDISMPRRDGFETAKSIKKEFPDIKIIFLTMHKSESTISKAFRSGCSGYILKNNAVDELTTAIRKVTEGEIFISSELTPMLINGFLIAEEASSDMTDRELDVFKLLAEGYTNKEIADMLSISVKTVETHRANIMHKNNFKNITELVLFAVRNHIIYP